MSQSNSKQIISNQPSLHQDLEAVVLKHLRKPDQRPISETQKQCFDVVWNKQQQLNQPFIFDTGCGTGMSSQQLAKSQPDKLIIGIDQSSTRLHKQHNSHSKLPNLIFVQARLEEFWLQSLQHQWFPDYQYFFYPNPWPKKKHLLRRWHGHPIFPVMLKVCPNLELRTNWEIYAKEFANALTLCNIKSSLEQMQISQPISAFEEKYFNSGHPLYRLKTL